MLCLGNNGLGRGSRNYAKLFQQSSSKRFSQTISIQRTTGIEHINLKPISRNDTKYDRDNLPSKCCLVSYTLGYSGCASMGRN